MRPLSCYPHHPLPSSFPKTAYTHQPRFEGLLDGKLTLKLKSSDQKKLAYVQQKLGLTDLEAMSFASSIPPGMGFFPSSDNHQVFMMDKAALDKIEVMDGSGDYQYKQNKITLKPDEFKPWQAENLKPVSSGKSVSETLMDMIPFTRKKVDFQDGRHRDTGEIFWSCLMGFGIPLLLIVPRHDKNRAVKGLHILFDALQQREKSPSLELVKVNIEVKRAPKETKPKEAKEDPENADEPKKKPDIWKEIKEDIFNPPPILSYTVSAGKVSLDPKQPEPQTA